MKLISIVTPSYNQGAFIEYCIKSVAENKKSGPLEQLVFDAGSNDATLNVLRGYDSVVDYWQSGPDGGQSDAINTGMDRAKGDILTWINSDDGLAPGASQAMRAALDDVEGPAWAIGACEIIDDRNRRTDLWRPTAQSSVEDVLKWSTNYIMQPAVFWNREMWKLAGPLNTNLHLAMDFDLWLRFFSVRPPIIIHDLVGVHRVHADTKTSNEGGRIFDEYLQVINARLASSKSLSNRAKSDVARALVTSSRRLLYHGKHAAALQQLRKAFELSPGGCLIDTGFFKALLKGGFGSAMSKLSLL